MIRSPFKTKMRFEKKIIGTNVENILSLPSLKKTEKLILDIANAVAMALDIKNNIILSIVYRQFDIGEGRIISMGKYRSRSYHKEVVINISNISNIENLINTICHEILHAYQHDCVFDDSDKSKTILWNRREDISKDDSIIAGLERCGYNQDNFLLEIDANMFAQSATFIVLKNTPITRLKPVAKELRKINKHAADGLFLAVAKKERRWLKVFLRDPKEISNLGFLSNESYPEPDIEKKRDIGEKIEKSLSKVF